jgi:hypothetical protein
MKQSIRILLWMVGITGCLSSCDGIMDDLYDEPEENSTTEYGFLSKSDGSSVGEVYVNASEYDRWIYIDFHTGKIDSVAIDTTAEPAEWDIALHRYDVKTNGAAALETSYTDLSRLVLSCVLPTGSYTEDIYTTNKVITDMSGMMQGHLVYASTYYNSVLSSWINVDTSTMPPVYTTSGSVYVIKLSDGTYAALLLKSYMNDSGVKGYMRFDYVYPLNLQ